MSSIIITLKLYSGLEKELEIGDYDVNSGIIIESRRGISLKRFLAEAGLKILIPYAFFSGGERISLRTKFKDSAEVSCLRISGGG
ncbi:MAG TPA: hypothetical protein PK358_05435 [Spirochaetota bacterium]|nr:hypothetical protein [Spirochaetota bacterium]HPJ34258.1 hypothetical protein [Spirochaetota bacterium]